MKITILKARRIGSAIETLLMSMLPLKRDRYGFREDKSGLYYTHDSVESATKDSDPKATSVLEKTDLLLDANFHLRQLIHDFNFNSDIDALMHETAKVKYQNSCLVASLQKYKKPLFNATNNKYSEGCSDELISSIQARIQKNNSLIQDLSDKCAFVNLNNEIVIEDKYVAILKDYDLLS